MRKGIRVLVVFLLSLLSTAVLGVVAAIMSAVSLAATALIVPGTGTPDANNVDLYRQHAIDRYSAPFNPSCTSTNGCTLTGINYPASFFPLVIFPGWCEPGRCDTWNDSVGQGVDGLVTAVQNLNDPDGAILFGYSQGGAVVSDALRELANNQTLLDKVSGVVLIGNAYNPDGGIFTRLGFLPTIPFLDITFGPKTPVELAEDLGKPMEFIGFQYDPVMYAPTFWGNGLTMLNALAAFQTVHGFYLTPNGNGPTDPIAYGYTEDEIATLLAGDCPGANCRVDSFGNEYWMLPARSLPMYDVVTSLVPAPLDQLVKPLVALVSPATAVLINLGYDFSGDPAQERWLSPLPFSPSTNFVQVGVDLVAAIGQGIENVLGGGGTTMIAPAPENNNVLALNAQTNEVEQTGESAKIEPSGQSDPPGAESDGSTTDAVAVTKPEDTAEPDASAPDATSADPGDAKKAEQAAEKAAREAEKAAEKADRAAEKAAEKAAREAQKAADKAAREAAKNAESEPAAA
jgi:pimeloyl-ACP methyl ester carboxylesterase